MTAAEMQIMPRLRGFMVSAGAMARLLFAIGINAINGTSGTLMRWTQMSGLAETSAVDSVDRRQQLVT